MCSVKVYLVAGMLLATSAAEQHSQWTPSSHQQPLQRWDSSHQQPLQQWDQQVAPSYSSGFDFTSQLQGHQSFENHGEGQEQDIHQQFPSTHQHVDEENPEPIKHYKEIVVPFSKNYEFKVNQPVLIPFPQPVPIHIPVPKAVVIPIIKEVSIPVEKSVPYPVERIVHVPQFKKVPFHIVKHSFVGVDKPVPFKVPVYETIIHTKKGSHKI